MAAPEGRTNPLRVELREREAPIRTSIEAALTAAGADVLRSSQGDPDVVVWSIVDERELDRLDLTHPSIRVLALVDEPSSGLVNGLLGAGARAVLDRQADPAMIARGAIAVARDYVVLPSDCSGAALQALRIRVGER